jgi:hypothetical protein
LKKNEMIQQQTMMMIAAVMLPPRMRLWFSPAGLLQFSCARRDER